MAREVRVGDTVGWRDTEGDWHDAVVVAVTNQDDIDITVPHISNPPTVMSNVVRMTDPTDTDVFRKMA